MVDEDRVGPGDGHAAETRAGGGTWLTYRYRFSGEGTPESTGTVKAPSFLNAARRILARGLGATVGPAPAYLRLRAVGEQETLFRVECTHAGDAAALRIDVVPSGTYQFAEVGPLATGGEPPAATV